MDTPIVLQLSMLKETHNREVREVAQMIIDLKTLTNQMFNYDDTYENIEKHHCLYQQIRDKLRKLNIDVPDELFWIETEYLFEEFMKY